MSVCVAEALHRTWESGVEERQDERACAERLVALVPKHRDAQAHQDEVQIEQTGQDLRGDRGTRERWIRKVGETVFRNI